jgi:hypothetical protein
MSALQIYNGGLLRVESKLAIDPACCCGCMWCLGSQSAAQFLVKIRLVADAGYCVNCDWFNDDFILERVSSCLWRYDSELACYDDPYIPMPVTITLEVDPDKQITVYVVWLAAVDMRFRKDYTPDKPPCASLNNEALPLISHSTNICDFDAATCEVTAL